MKYRHELKYMINNRDHALIRSRLKNLLSSDANVDSDFSCALWIGKDWAFKEIVSDQTLADITNIQIPPLPSREYFWQATATNESGKHQHPFDVYFHTNGEQHSGLKRFYSTSEGKVLE
jgi:hypothetical protein